MADIQDAKQKILSIIRIKGPSLPVHIARETRITMLFASAFLAELASEKTIKISNMKVGGSPLYFLPGQELYLEKFYKYLPSKEREAFLLLKNKKILEDTKQQPAIRVALRNIRDFALPFKNEKAEIFWRYFTLSKEETIKIMEPEKKKEAVKQEEKKKEEKPKPKETKGKVSQEGEGKFIRKPGLSDKEETPILELKPIKIPAKKKEKEKSEFVQRIIGIFEAVDIEILEEIWIKKREYVAKVRINSELGKIEFLAFCKDKRATTENDLTIAHQKAQSLKLPTLFISTGNLNKKAEKYLEEWKNLIKFKKI